MKMSKVSQTKFAKLIMDKKFGADVDDTSLVVRTLRDHPIYQYRFSEKKVKGGLFQRWYKESSFRCWC